MIFCPQFHHNFVISLVLNFHQIVIDLAAEKLKESTMKDKMETLSLVTSLLPDIEMNMDKLQKIHEKETNKLVALKNDMAVLEIKSQKEKEILEKHKVFF